MGVASLGAGIAFSALAKGEDDAFDTAVAEGKSYEELLEIDDSGKGFKDGPVSTAEFDSPYDIALDDNGDIYVVDRGNHRIRKIIKGGERDHSSWRRDCRVR